jgi:cell division protein FtsQ
VQLLGRGLVRFDMRIPGKFIVRVSKEPGSTVPDLEALKPQQAVPVDGVKTI